MGSTGRPRARRAATLAASALVLAALGPFGTFLDFGFGGRLAYWGGLILAGAVVFEGVIGLTMGWCLEHRHDWRLAVAATLLVTSVVQTGVVAVVDGLARGHGAGRETPLAELFFYVLLITLLVSAWPLRSELKARGLLDHPGSPAAPASEPAAEVPVAAASSLSPASDAATARFLARLPGGLPGPLLALEMEDHYLRVHTASGNTLILMRLRDAVEELAALDGLQVHRSFWVAATAVVQAARDGSGRVTLVLSNGLRVPVSRSRLPAVRAAGWLEEEDGP